MKEEVEFFERQFILTTYINEEGVYVRLFPLLVKYKFFSWDIISKSYIRKYNPILEYGGWGIRYGGFRFNLLRVNGLNFRNIMNKNVAYNISGNIGLQLELKSGKRVLIGTRKPVEMGDVLQKLGKLEE